MWVWTGYGFVVPIIALVILAFVQLIADSLMGNGYYATHMLPKILGAIITATVLRPVGQRMNDPTNAFLCDRKSREQYQSDPNHTFFFIPVEYCGYALVIFITVGEVIKSFRL